MIKTIRFLTKDDYSACVDVVLSQREYIEKIWKEDYRNWIQPLSGWLHPESYDRFNGSFMNQNKRLAGTFCDNILVGFSGLICYETRDNVAIFTSRVSNSKSTHISSDELYGEQLKFLFEWGLSIGKNNIFACHHPKISKKTQKITTIYLPKYSYNVISHYGSYIHAEGWDQEIMGYGVHPFPIDIGNWQYKKENK